MATDDLEIPLQKVDNTNKKGISIKTKYAVGIGVLILLTSLFTNYYILKEAEQRLIDRTKDVMRTTIFQFCQTAREYFHEDEMQLVINLVNNLRQIKSFEITQALVINDSDRVIKAALTNRNIIGKKLSHISDDLPKERWRQAFRAVDIPKTVAEYSKVRPKEEQYNDGRNLSFSLPIYNIRGNTISARKPVYAMVVIDISLDRVYEDIASLRMSLLGFIALSLIVAFMITYVYSGRLVAPIQDLMKGAKEIGAGNLNTFIDIKANDEIGELAGEFNAMTGKLEQAQKVMLKNAKSEQLLETAHQIQEGLVAATTISMPGVDCAFHYNAALGVGGDYFDIVDMGNGTVGVIVMDVSGKGVPASLVMVMIKTVFSSSIEHIKDPALLAGRINDFIADKVESGLYATGYIYTLDPKTGHMSFTNCGHHPMAVFRGDGTIERMDLDGPPVGIMEDQEFPLGNTTMNPGDVVILYTDGINEAMNPKREEFTSDRLDGVVKDNREKNSQEIVDTVMGDIKTFIEDAPQHDDETLVIVKRT